MPVHSRICSHPQRLLWSGKRTHCAGVTCAAYNFTRLHLRRYGVGGLLMEIVSRPQPRSGGAPAEAEE